MSSDEDHPKWSGVINQTMTAAKWIASQSLPDLSPAEWELIVDAYIDIGNRESLQHPPYRIASDLMDYLGLLDVADHPNPELVKRIHAMGQAEQFAILTCVQRFWNGELNVFSDNIKIIA